MGQCWPPVTSVSASGRRTSNRGPSWGAGSPLTVVRSEIGVAARRVVLRAVSVVDEVDATEVRVAVVIARLVARRSGRLGSWRTRLFMWIAVGTDDECGVVPIVETVRYATP